MFLITNTKWALHVQATFLLFPIYLVKKKIIPFKITIIIKAKIKTTIMTRTIMAAIKLKIS